MNPSFHKMHGCGNDFLLVDNLNDGLEFDPKWVAGLCDRHFGLGADGVAVLSRGTDTDAKWVFYNCDGGEAEMCGNAARCAVLYLTQNHFKNKSWITIETAVGSIQGRQVDESLVEVSLPMGLDTDYEEKLIKLDDQALRVYFINTGVPHAVIEVEDIKAYPIAKVGQFLVGHPIFKPSGTNVTFLQKQYLDEIFCTTFERGVETETYACGTGVAAGALIFSQLYAQKFPIKVNVPGGMLSVDQRDGKILLKGAAQYVAEVALKSDPKAYEKHSLFSHEASK